MKLKTKLNVCFRNAKHYFNSDESIKKNKFGLDWNDLDSVLWLYAKSEDVCENPESDNINKQIYVQFGIDNEQNVLWGYYEFEEDVCGCCLISGHYSYQQALKYKAKNTLVLFKREQLKKAKELRFVDKNILEILESRIRQINEDYNKQYLDEYRRTY